MIKLSLSLFFSLLVNSITLRDYASDRYMVTHVHVSTPIVCLDELFINEKDNFL